MLITMSVSGLSDNIRSLDPEERRYLLCSYPWIRGLRSWKACWWRQGRERPWCQCPGCGGLGGLRHDEGVQECLWEKSKGWENVMRLENWCRDSRTSMWDWCCGTGGWMLGMVRVGLHISMVPIPEKPVNPGLFPTRSVRRWRDSAYAVSVLPGPLTCLSTAVLGWLARAGPIWPVL